MAQPVLFVLVPGFGAPHVDKKRQILRNNLSVFARAVANGVFGRVHVRICCYDGADPVVGDGGDGGGGGQGVDVEAVHEKGIVGGFIRRHGNPGRVAADYVCLIWDDIEMDVDDPTDLGAWMRYLRDLRLDIVSPSLSRDSQYQYEYMRTDPRRPAGVKICPVCEAFCYLMPMEAYARYWAHVSEDNPWLWGLDLVLRKHLGLHVGIMNHQVVRHYFKGDGYGARPDVDPVEGFKRAMERYGERAEDLAEQPAVMYWVIDVVPAA